VSHIGQSHPAGTTIQAPEFQVIRNARLAAFKRGMVIGFSSWALHLTR
jgi:hypothetical protein